MKNQPWSVLRFTGSRTWDSKTHKSNTAVVDSGWVAGVPTVKFQLAATHYISVGSAVVLKGSVNYDGTYKALAGTATDVIYVPASYVAETLTTTDTFKLTLAPGQAFEWGGFRLELNAAVTTAANLTVALDAGAGATYDTRLYTKAMATVQYISYNITDAPLPFDKLDELDFAWANADNLTYGLEVLWRRA